MPAKTQIFIDTSTPELAPAILEGLNSFKNVDEVK